MPAVKEKKAKVWDRSPHDWYVDPDRCTRQLLAEESFQGRIHDPCCGGGNIVKTCIEHGYKATGSDLIARVDTPKQPWFLGCYDFERETPKGKPFDNVIMNPPFFKGQGTLDFIYKCMKLTRGKICVFTEARFLFGDARGNDLYLEHPPSRVYLIAPRPSCPTGEYIAQGGKVGGGNPDFTWLVWDLVNRPTSTELRWLTSRHL